MVKTFLPQFLLENLHFYKKPELELESGGKLAPDFDSRFGEIKATVYADTAFLSFLTLTVTLTVSNT